MQLPISEPLLGATRQDATKSSANGPLAYIRRVGGLRERSFAQTIYDIDSDVLV